MPATTPGSRVAGRYVLDGPAGSLPGHRGAAAGGEVGPTRWPAVDEVLHRPVTVWTMPTDHPDAARFLQAAQRCAALADSRFLRVLDALTVEPAIVVVTERVSGVTLTEQLTTGGPLAAASAVTLGIELAAAVHAAHTAGLSGLQLTPDAVVRTHLGPTKIDRLVLGEVDARDESGVAADTRAVAAILYAALTARWPQPPGHAVLPPAPLGEGGRVCTPRQVRAGVPAEVDDVVERALNPDTRRPVGPINTPVALAEALGRLRLSDDTPVAVPDLPRLRPATTRIAQLSAAAVLVGGLGLAGYQVATNTFGAEGPSAGRRTGASSSSGAAQPVGSALTIAGVADFDPDGDGSENPEDVGKAVDGDPRTAWRTQTYYRRPDLGGLKPGVGLLVDLGKVQSVRSVELRLDGAGTRLELRAARSRAQTAAAYQRVVVQVADSAQVTLRAAAPVRARYLLIWFTSLPEVSSGRYRGGVAEITVYG